MTARIDPDRSIRLARKSAAMIPKEVEIYCVGVASFFQIMEKSEALGGLSLTAAKIAGATTRVLKGSS